MVISLNLLTNVILTLLEKCLEKEITYSHRKDQKSLVNPSRTTESPLNCHLSNGASLVPAPPRPIKPPTLHDSTRLWMSKFLKQIKQVDFWWKIPTFGNQTSYNIYSTSTDMGFRPSTANIMFFFKRGDEWQTLDDGWLRRVFSCG